MQYRACNHLVRIKENLLESKKTYKCSPFWVHQGGALCLSNGIDWYVSAFLDYSIQTLDFYVDSYDPVGWAPSRWPGDLEVPTAQTREFDVYHRNPRWKLCRCLAAFTTLYRHSRECLTLEFLLLYWFRGPERSGCRVTIQLSGPPRDLIGNGARHGGISHKRDGYVIGRTWL